MGGGGNNEPRYPDVNTNGTLSVYFGRFSHFKGINKLYRDCLYGQLLCVICPLRDHVTLFLFLQSLIKQCIFLQMPFSSPFPTLCNVENEAKLCIHFVCGVGEGGRGADRACVVKKKRLNRLFVASHSRCTKPPYWKARYALGKDKQKEITIFKNDVRRFCLVPLRPLHSSMVVRFKLRISQSRMWADKNSSSQFLWS